MQDASPDRERYIVSPMQAPGTAEPRPGTDSAVQATRIGFALVVVGLVALVNWWLPGHGIWAEHLFAQTMKANSAVCIMLCGVIVISLAGRLPMSTRAMAIGCILLISVGTLVEYALGQSFFLDEVLARDTRSETLPGRMAPATALAFLLAALLALARSVERIRRRRVPYAMFAFLGLSLPLIGGSAHLFAEGYIADVGFFRTMSVPTSVSLIMYYVGIVLNAPGDNLSSVVIAQTREGRLTRLLILVVLAAPIAIVGISTYITSAGWLPAGVVRTTAGAIGTTTALVGIVFLMSREQRISHQLRDEQRERGRLESTLLKILNETEEVILAVSPEMTIKQSSASVYKLLGWSPEELRGQSIEMLIPRAMRTRHKQIVKDFVARGNESAANDDPTRMVALHRNGDEISVMTSVVRRRLEDGVEFGVVMRSAVRIEKQLREIQRVARYDPLTGVPNRLAFESWRGQGRLVSFTTAVPVLPVAIASVDVDNFKTLNDTFGHGGGDALLRAFAWRVQQYLSEDSLIFRTGGDEFIIVFGSACGDPLAAAEEIRAGVAGSPLRFDAGEAHVTCSIGLAFTRDEDLTSVIERSDRALYLVKEHGRNAVFSMDENVADSSLDA